MHVQEKCIQSLSINLLVQTALMAIVDQLVPLAHLPQGSRMGKDTGIELPQGLGLARTAANVQLP